jgi:hypothetical protein
MMCSAELPTRLISRIVLASRVIKGMYVVLAERRFDSHSEHGQCVRSARVATLDSVPPCHVIASV